MNLDLSNKNAWVGGSSKGIGWATAVELATMGAHVTLVARNEKALIERLAMLPQNGNQRHDYLVIDFSDFSNLREAVTKKLSDRSYHILINNTGGPAGGKLIEEDAAKFETTFSQHLLANQFLAQSFVPFMKAEAFGRIVNIISISVKQPILGLGVSNTIRWAVAAWAKTLSKELGEFGITVNNVLPGYTATDRLQEVNLMRAQASGVPLTEIENQILTNVPLARFVLSEEVAAAAAFLCSVSAAAISGVNLPVDGGFSQSL
jgi:3-oxoacyl-[acyl-carrier protein] reductase